MCTYEKKVDQGPREGTVLRGIDGRELSPSPQKILVFQQCGSGENKVRGIRKYGEGLFVLEMISIDEPLPPVIDDTSCYLPRDIGANLVLDFLKHPDLSQDLARFCSERHIPLVASGKKLHTAGVATPPT